MNHRQLVLFYVLIVFYTINKVVSLSGMHIPLITDYFNDLICLPILLTAALVFMQIINDGDYIIGNYKMLMTWLILSLWNELLLPTISKKYTADKYDVICYAVGLLIFAAFMNRKNYIIPK